MKPDKNPKAWSDVAGACHTSPLLEIITSSQWKRSLSRHFSASISLMAQQKPQPFFRGKTRKLGGKFLLFLFFAMPARLSLCETSTQARGMIPILRKFSIARLLDSWTQKCLLKIKGWFRCIMKQSLSRGTFVRICFVFFCLFLEENAWYMPDWSIIFDVFFFFFFVCSFNDLEKIQLESRGNAWGRPGPPNNQFCNGWLSIGWFQINIKNGWKSPFPFIKKPSCFELQSDVWFTKKPAAAVKMSFSGNRATEPSISTRPG